MKVGRRSAGRTDVDETARNFRGGSRQRAVAPVGGRNVDRKARKRRAGEGPARETRARTGNRARRPHEPRGLRQGPQTVPAPRPTDRPARANSANQAKARAKARKAKAPKVIRPPLRERILARLAAVDLRPQTLLARVPFVVLIIGSLAIGLAITLWLSTDAAQRSYQLGGARELNDALTQQKEALERDVLEAQSAPALADAARDLGMIPSKDTAHLVQDPVGNWVVVGEPKPAEGVPPPPLNTKLPEELPPAPKPATAPPSSPMPGAEIEVPVRLSPSLPGAIPAPGQQVPALIPSVTDTYPHTGAGGVLPGLAPLPGPGSPGSVLPGAAVPRSVSPGSPVPESALPGSPVRESALPGSAVPWPGGDTLVTPPAAAAGVSVPTVTPVVPVVPVFDAAPGVLSGGVAN